MKQQQKSFYSWGLSQHKEPILKIRALGSLGATTLDSDDFLTLEVPVPGPHGTELYSSEGLGSFVFVSLGYPWLFLVAELGK